MTDSTETGELSSGGTSLEGYFYQLDVSILTALDLVLAKKVARSVVLEPASEEDLEADVEGAPGALTEEFELDAYRLVIQCKLRSTGPWKHEELTRLLAHGTERKPAKERLLEPDIRYLLVTSADLDGVARKLRVEVIGEWPPVGSIPKEMGKNLPADAGGRLAVLASMDQEKVDARIDRLLTERFRVPQPNLKSCRTSLRDDALLRMRGAARGKWDRSDLERIIALAGGYTGESDALEGFVPPTNWDALKGALNTRSAVIITGASGTGKTRAAKALIADLRDNIAGLRHVIIQGGPEKIWADQQAGAAVYEIEDPWGRFRLEPTSVPWNDAMNDILQSARPDRRFVVTSRSDVLRESNPKSINAKWFVSLEEENYGPKERVTLFENRLPSLAPELQPVALRYRRQAIERLLTPLEMHRYFAVLADGSADGENEAQFIERCLSDAHLSSIETALLHGVRHRQAWGWAAIIWGLFKARSRLSFTVLPSIQALLTKRQADLEDGLEPYINFLIAGRNLRQSEATLTYQHPRVELGLELALKDKPGQSSRLLGYLIDALIELDTKSGGDWGVEGAAHLISEATARETIAIAVSSDAQAALDRWLEKRLANPGADFEEDLDLAAAVGSRSCIPAEVARWLVSPPKSDKESWFFDGWSAPERSPDWYGSVRSHTSTHSICAAFITRLLPRRNRSFPDDFAEKITQLSADLTPAFLEAAMSVVEDGYNPNADAIAEGALKDIEAFENVVAEAAEYETKLAEKGDDGLWLSIANGEYDDAAAEHYYESGHEDGLTAGEFLERYALERRRRDGWKALRDHTYSSQLAGRWLDIAAKESDVTEDEWTAISELVKDTWVERRLWDRLCGNLPGILVPQLRNRLRAGSEDRAIRLDAAKTAIHSTDIKIADIVSSLVSDGNFKRVLEFALDVTNADDDKDDDAKTVFAEARRDIAETVSEPLAEVIKTLFSPASAPMSAAAQAYLAQIEFGGNNEAKLVQAELLSAGGVSIEPWLREILLASGDNDAQLSTAKRAAELAVEKSLNPLLEECLKHRFADVRQVALIALATATTGALPSDMLSFASDKGHRVRSAVLDLIKARGHEGHMSAILQLAQDTWTPDQVHYGEEAHFPIAQSAAELLWEPPQLDDAYISTIGGIFHKSSDHDVKLALMQALVRNGTDEARRRVMREALRTGNPPHHRLAAEALVKEHAQVDAALASEITDDHLLLKAAAVSYQLTLVAGLCADVGRVSAVAKTLAAKPERRAFLLPLALAAIDRDENLVEEIKSFLPQSIAANFRDALGGTAKLSRCELRAMGDVRTVEVVLYRLAKLFEPETEKSKAKKD
ncbi:hypothetical protein ACVI1J_004937 [Bradyrhizobium diazoefficiens]